MKQFTHTAIVLAAALCAPAVFAQQNMDDMNGMDMPKKTTPDAQVTHHATGVAVNRHIAGMPLAIEVMRRRKAAQQRELPGVQVARVPTAARSQPGPEMER